MKQLKPDQTGMRKFISGFGHAIDGLIYAYRTQCNIRVHAAIAVPVVALMFLAPLSTTERAILIIAIATVFAAELFNTAIEAVVDLAMPDYHELAKIAKDTAAGGVLIAALGAAIVGAIILLPVLQKLHI